MPVSAISPFGPIFAKELRVASRRRRNYFLRVLYLGALLLFLLLAWSITRESYSYGGNVARQQQQEQLGWFFFMFFSMFSVIAMGLIGPVLTSTAINGERDAKTFHVLLMTPLSAWQIVSGKLFSRLLTALTLIGLSLPVLALVRLLGGVELGQMFGIIALAVVVAMTSAAMGLLLSILIRRAYAVILLSYMLLGLAYLFMPLMLTLMASNQLGMSRMFWLKALAACNPFMCASLIASGQMRLIGVSWVPCVLLHLGVTAVLLLFGAVLLRRLARKEGEGTRAGAKAAEENALTGNPAAVAPGEAPIGAPAQGKARARSRRIGDHPILWRELRRPLMASPRQGVAGAVIVLLLLSLTYFAAASNHSLGDRDLQFGYSFVFYTLLLLVTCVISAAVIAQEKEGDQWAVLLSSPLSGRAIVWGKAIGAAWRMFWPAMLILVHFLIFTVAGIVMPATFLTIIVVMILFNTIWIATGVSLSLVCRKVTVAVILNLALPLLLYGVGSLLLTVMDELVHSQGKVAIACEIWLPWYYLGAALDGGSVRGMPILPGTNNAHCSQWGFLAVALVVGLIHMALAAGLLAIVSARFNRIVRRAPQRDLLTA